MSKAKDLSRLAIDGVFCISLKERNDRRELLRREFAGSGLEIEFILVERDNESPERGCFDSHMKCARTAVERGYRRVLILEDDATLLAFEQIQVEQINRFLEHSDPELFYLGANLGKVWLTWRRGIARVRARGTHAYIVSNRGCRRLLQQSTYSGTAIDRILSERFRAYMAFPMLSQQQPEEVSSSDILRARSSDGTAADAAFWRDNWRRQYSQAVRNVGKTLLLRDL
ncbi:glycosyl transferase family 25 [Pseudomonas hunanensis]|uniref:Glycosyl transferase family 25 n=1 Tax=Pseudomonas hunanensis TaxID=1247546 RepID=A0ACC6K4N8_9PSED|nr:glycosyltransferase family 25 protein [Pseudomonas hunanensis]MDR6713341.1 glycosyl transferase family 25 [Pseudomonas hunanensis]